MSRQPLFTPASDWCLRWRDRRHSWRHRSEGGFDSRRYEVAELADDGTPRAFTIRHHYSHSYVAAVRRYGLYDRSGLVGTAVLSIPTQRRVLTSVFPALVPYVESVELGRFVLLDAVPGNAESWFWARCRELAARSGIRGIVTFSDPIARTDAIGHVVFPGHRGTIYQASNALYLGRATARTLYLLPDATVLNDRALSKVRAGERGHEYVERLLMRWGAAPRPAGMPGTEWLPDALAQAGVRRLRHSGNYRYAWKVGQRRRYVALGRASAAPYPKEVS
ncbi:MAG: hypothetical protein ACRDJN_32265 [Chloroflexota bacterium]